MKKIFGGINLTWKKLIIGGVVIGVIVGLLNSVSFLNDTTITDIATYFDFWIFCGIFIIMNSKSNKDSALKCFVFFLISQPLIYLCEAPFNQMGLGLFVYYKNWIIWTLLTIPMGYIGYYIKKDKWYGLLILLPMLILLGYGLQETIVNIKYSFPKHLINTLFIISTFILYPLLLFKNKKIKYIGLIISIILIICFGFKPITSPSTYDTIIKCDSDEFPVEKDSKVYLEDKKYGDLTIGYIKQIESYCINASFKKPGNTKLIIEMPEGDKRIYNIKIGKMTFTLGDEIK